MIHAQLIAAMVAIATMVAPSSLSAADTKTDIDRPTGVTVHTDKGAAGNSVKTSEAKTRAQQLREEQYEKWGMRMREKIAERQAQDFDALHIEFALSTEEFSAIKPLIERVENLQAQRYMIDPLINGKKGSQSSWTLNPKYLLGETAMEPSVRAIADAITALQDAARDIPDNVSEINDLLKRVRLARENFMYELKIAQLELRSVLSVKQEAQLVTRGTLN